MSTVYSIDSDESSQSSEADTNLLDEQPWENVQMASVRAMGASSDSTEADFLWLQNQEEDDESLTKSSQMVRTNNSSRERESPNQQSRRPFPNEVLRNETSNTRKLKACVRCRMQKIRVIGSLYSHDMCASNCRQCIIDGNDPSGECKTCQSVSKHRLYTLPCARYKLTECTIYRTGKAPGLEFTFRWPYVMLQILFHLPLCYILTSFNRVMKLKDITKWADNQVRTIKIMSDVCLVPYELNVRRFVPLPQDSRKRGWMDGKVKKFKETTPFAIVNMAAALKDMKEYVDVNVFECVKYFIRHTNDLVHETYDFARKHMERHNVSSSLLLGICYLC
jgi:hypothetical protein